MAPRLLPALGLSLTLAACGGSSYGSGSSSKSSKTASSGQAGSAVVKSASNPTLATAVLTEAHGMTLYSLSGETAGRLICTSPSCVALWHPLSLVGTSTPSGASSLGTFRRPDGSVQVTFRGMPLYTFSQDRRPGEVKGQHLKDVGTWSVVVAGSPGASSQGASQPAPSTSAPTGRYGY